MAVVAVVAAGSGVRMGLGKVVCVGGVEHTNHAEGDLAKNRGKATLSLACARQSIPNDLSGRVGKPYRDYSTTSTGGVWRKKVCW